MGSLRCRSDGSTNGRPARLRNLAAEGIARHWQLNGDPAASWLHAEHQGGASWILSAACVGRGDLMTVAATDAPLDRRPPPRPQTENQRYGHRIDNDDR